ncbi:retrovirus-related pol polyprotein from transposon TNT 1-94 [Tanacetum coccineum]
MLAMVNILLSMDEDSNWQNYLKYIHIDLKYVEEQRLNLLSNYNKIIFELNKCRDDLLVLKQAKLEAITFQIQNTKLTKLNYALQDQLKEERKGDSPSSDVMTLTYQDHSPRERSGLGTMKHTKPETQESSNKNVSRHVIVSNLEPVTSSVPTESKRNDQESKINELTKLVQMLMDKKINSTQKTREPKIVSSQPESSKLVNSSKQSQDSKPNDKNSDSSKLVRPKPLQKPKLKCELRNYTNHSTNDCCTILYCIKCKREDHMTSDHNMYIASLRSSQNYKAQPYLYASPSKQILKSKAKPYPLCTHCGFNDHRLDDCKNYPECEICGSYDHFTSEHNRIIQIRGGVLAKSSQSSESSIGVSCTTYGSSVHSTTDHNNFEHFITGEKLQATKAKEPTKRPVSQMSINHEKYTLVIVEEYSRMVDNQNDVKVKQIKIDNGTEFINTELKSFCDEKGISQNSSSPYTLEQNGVAERKNRTLIEAARTIDPGEAMLTRSMAAKLTVASAIWTLVPLPYGKIAIGSNWVFMNKKDEHGIVIKNKARLVAQGYSQEKGIDYDKTFTPVARMEAIRIFLAFATYMNFIVFQMDVKSVFLNGKLKKEVYVKQPLDFESSEFPDSVCKLDKTLYGLKQAQKACSSVKKPMVLPNNLGPGLAGKPINETLYRGMIGYLMYLTATRPDIKFSTCLCATYQSSPKELYLTIVKKIFRYLKGTPSLGLWYPMCLGFNLKGYSDSDYAGCNMDKKRTSCACQILGGKLVCWSAKKQQSVAMSSTEAEYVAAAGCCTNILWMKSQLSYYEIYYKMVPIFCDNTSAIAISNNPVLYSRTKHIDIKYHFTRDHILKGEIELHFIPTKYQLADIFTKSLDEPTFTKLKAELDMLNID